MSPTLSQGNATNLSPTVTPVLQPGSNSGSASDTIQTLAFGICGVLFAIATIYLAYRQLQHTVRTAVRLTTNTELEEQPSMSTTTCHCMQRIHSFSRPSFTFITRAFD